MMHYRIVILAYFLISALLSIIFIDFVQINFTSQWELIVCILYLHFIIDLGIDTFTSVISFLIYTVLIYYVELATLIAVFIYDL